MNVTFLIGNGFDLQLGMETGYKSFLNWYVNLETEDEDIAEFRKYLREEKGEWWSDAEIAMGQYLGNFSDDMIHIFFKNIRDLKLRLSEYLLNENSKYDLDNDPEVIRLFKDFIMKSAGDIMLRPQILTLDIKRRQNQTAINFVTFNYTDALDRLLRKVSQLYGTLETFNRPNASFYTKIGNIYHVHGTLDSSIVMGVDNLDQLDSRNINDFSKLSRTLIKPLVNDELGRDDHENAAYTLNNSDYLFFYGLSFGDTDRTWWNLIRDHILKNVNCQAVIFTRSTEEDDIQAIIPEDVLDYVNDKKDEFLQKIGIELGSEDYETVRKRIFVIRNTQRLNISIRDREVLQEEKELVLV